MDNLRAIVLSNGDPVAASLPLPDDALVIAADGGLSLAAPLGLRVDVVVGDLDSASTEDLATTDARIERYPAGKDATDLELALDAAIASGATEITVVGGVGGRLDHLLANALLLASERYGRIPIRWLTGTETAAVADRNRPATVTGAVGDRVSLIPIGGPAREVTTTGLHWPLTGEDLPAGSTRGISNEMTETTATVTLTAGTLLVVQEGAPS